MSNPRKTCPRCGAEKDQEDFYRNRTSADGVQHQCKQCEAARYLAERDKILEQRKAYYLANRDRVIQRAREWEVANHDKAAARKRDHRIANRDRHAKNTREKMRRYQAETSVFATRRGEPYADWEDFVVLYSSKTIKEIALELGRTHASIAQRRSHLVRKVTNP